MKHSERVTLVINLIEWQANALALFDKISRLTKFRKK